MSKNDQFSGSYCFEDLKRDQFIFAFPLTPMRVNIEYPLNKFSLFDLFRIASLEKSSSVSDF